MVRETLTCVSITSFSKSLIKVLFEQDFRVSALKLLQFVPFTSHIMLCACCVEDESAIDRSCLTTSSIMLKKQDFDFLLTVLR